MGKKIYLIVGLGNPGEQYAHTRHNAGFEVIGRLEETYGVRLKKKLLLQGMAAEYTDGDRKIVLCEPLTYMNNSGVCVKKLLDRYKVPPEQMIVIYDDIDLPPGKVRVRAGGGAGTHNGMRSILDKIGTENFPRIRIGTGDRPQGEDLAAWVLGRCSEEERPVMKAAFKTAADCAAEWTEKGIQAAMQLCGRSRG